MNEVSITRAARCTIVVNVRYSRAGDIECGNVI
jgi:hypothetical protein